MNETENVVVEYANYLILAPVDLRASDDEDFKDFLKHNLIGRKVKQGDILTIDLLKHQIEFHVIYSMPSGTVKITPATKLLFELNIVSNQRKK